MYLTHKTVINSQEVMCSLSFFDNYKHSELPWKERAKTYIKFCLIRLNLKAGKIFFFLFTKMQQLENILWPYILFHSVPVVNATKLFFFVTRVSRQPLSNTFRQVWYL